MTAMRLPERALDEVARGIVIARVTALSPLRVVVDGTEVVPVVSQTIVDRTAGITVGSQVLGAWSDNDPDQLIALDLLG